MLMPNLREIWHFKLQNHLHQRIVNPRIEKFFLQYCYNAILHVELHCCSIVKKNKKFVSDSLSSVSHLSHYCCSLLSLPSLFLHLLSHLWSFIAIPWVLDFGGWISVDRRTGFGSVSWDRLMVGLDRLIGGFETVDLLIDGWIGWVDHQ